MQYYCFSVPDIHCISCKSAIDSALNKKKLNLKINRFSVDVPGKTLSLWVDDQENINSNQFYDSVRAILDDIGFSCFIQSYKFYLPNLQTEQINEIENLVQSFTDLDIAKAKVNLKNKEIRIEVDSLGLSEQEFFAEIKKRLHTNGVICTNPLSIKKILKSNWLVGGLGIFLGLSLVITCLLIPHLAFPLHLGIALFSTISTLALGWESIKSTWNNKFRFSMDSLFVLSSFSALAVSLAGLFIPGLPMMFEAALLIFGFRRLGMAIEQSMMALTKRKKLFSDYLPKEVIVKENNNSIKKPIYNIKIDDILELNPGEVVPVDGIALVSTIIDPKNLTGQDDYIQIKMGEIVKAGSKIAADANVTQIKTTSTSKNSSLAEADKRLLQTPLDNSPLEEKTSKFFRYFIPIVLGIALLSFGLISYFYGFGLGMQCAIAVLVSACPCTLGMIVPLAMKIGMYRAAENKVFFNSAKGLEDASEIDTVVFDWNGTLTESNIIIKDCAVIENFSKEKLIAYANLLEQKSSNIIGKAIYQYTKPLVKVEISNLHGLRNLNSGVAASINTEEVLLGNQELMQQNNINTSDIDKEVELEAGESLIYFATGGKIKGYFIIKTDLRKDAAFVIQNLMKGGVEFLKPKKVIVCTGTPKNILPETRKIGLPDENIYINAIAFPDGSEKQDKGTIIKNLPGRVAMIGDWNNDTLAVNASSFSIAIEHDKKQLDTSAYIHDGPLKPVLTAFVIAEQTVKNIKQNLALSLIYNIASMTLASGLFLSLGLGAVNPGLCVAFMIIQSLLIFYNAYRIKNQKINFPENSTEKFAGSYIKMYSKLNFDLVKRNDIEMEKVIRSDNEVSNPDFSCELETEFSQRLK